MRQPGSPAAQGGSPDHFRYVDASVDSLQQQRAKLKPVQTSKHAALPASVQQGFAAAPALLPTGAANLNLRGVHPHNAGLHAARTGQLLSAVCQRKHCCSAHTDDYACTTGCAVCL